MTGNVSYSDNRCQEHFVGNSDARCDRDADSVGMFDLKARAKDIGRRVAYLRTQAGMTQEDLGAAIGRSRSFVANIENGGDTSGIQGLIAIADEFKVPLDWLLGRPVPQGGPLASHFVDDMDELAWLNLWRQIDPADRPAALRLLMVNRKAVA